MNARELLQSGNLSAAIEAATQAVRTAPHDVTARIFLFELLAASGQWERARKHLDVALDQAPAMQEGIMSYGGVLEAERSRARLFEVGEGEPAQVIPVPMTTEPQLTALRGLRAGTVAESKQLLDQAEDERPTIRGTVNGVAFDDFRDADDVLAPFLEVLSQGRYGWIRMAQLKRARFHEAKYFRDLLWIPVDIVLIDDSPSRMLVPVRYPGSEQHPDDLIKLGRQTDWRDVDGVVQGLGQRAFVAGEDLRYILEIRELEFH